MKGFIQFVGMCFLAWAVFFGYKIYQASQQDEKNLNEHPCISDWRQCKDMSDLMEHNVLVSSARSACAVYAEVDLGDQNAKWDESWTYTKFPIYYKTEPFKESGILLLEDHRGIVPFSDGVDRRTPMECSYDLNEKSHSVQVAKNLLIPSRLQAAFLFLACRKANKMEDRCHRLSIDRS